MSKEIGSDSVIADNLAAEAPDLMAGEIEVDESYFGGARKGKRGRGAAGKTPVFGLLKRGGKVYAVTIPNARRETLLPIIENKIQPDSIVYTDSFQVYGPIQEKWRRPTPFALLLPRI